MMKHVDDWIDEPTRPSDTTNMAYAKFFFVLARFPAHMQHSFRPWTKQFKLFCTYENKRYRVTGASRLGDIWLAEDHERTVGYDHRVDLAECTDWSNEP